MTDIARLGIAVESATVPQATQQLDRLGDQAAVTGQQVATGTAAANRGFSSLAAPLRNLTGSNGFRQVSMQLSQVAQQATATGQPMQALAIQAADIGMVFGPMGIAAGVAAGALIPLAANLFSAADAADAAEAAFDELATMQRALRENTDRLRLSVEEMGAEYGESAELVRQFAISQAEAMVAQAENRLKDQILVMGDLIDQYGEATRVVDEFGSTSFDITDNLRALQRDLGVSRDQALQLFSAFQQLDEARAFEDQRDALAELDELFESLGITSRELPGDLNNALIVLRDMVFSASQFEALMKQASDAANDFQFPRPAPATPGFTFGGRDFGRGVPGGGGAFVDPASGFGGGTSTRTPSARGGGGMSDAERLHIERLREAERVFQRTRTEAERYAQELADLSELHALGYLSAEEYARAVEMVGASLNGVDLSPMEQGIKDMADAMANAIVNTENMGDAIVNTFKRIAAEYLAQDLRNIFGTLFGAEVGGGGGGGGSFLSTLFGGARARGGPVSAGKAYLVGEEGPELFSPSSGGTIIPAQQTRHMTGGGGTVVNQSFTFNGGVTEADLGRAFPVMIQAAKREMVDFVQRGGAGAQAFR